MSLGPGHARVQDISSHGIELVLLAIFRLQHQQLHDQHTSLHYIWSRGGPQPLLRQRHYTRLCNVSSNQSATGMLEAANWWGTGDILHGNITYIVVEHSLHYNDVIMGTIVSQIASFTIVYSMVYSGADQRKHQSSATLAFVRWIHRGLVTWPVTWKMFLFDDVIMSPVSYRALFQHKTIFSDTDIIQIQTIMKIRLSGSYTFLTMILDDVVMQWARASASVILNMQIMVMSLLVRWHLHIQRAS